MQSGLMIYGAYGYTGRLAVEEACRAGLSPIVAGRSASSVAELAQATGLEGKAFPLDEPSRVRSELAQVGVVLNAAGPYSRTCKPIVDACIALGITYIDLSGEFDVLERLRERDGEARTSGSMIMPAAGFDVVPSDCLALHLKRRLPEADRLRLFIGGLDHLSRGTLRTAMESIDRGTRVRREGRVVKQALPGRDRCDFGRGPVPVIGVTLADVATSWWSCQIPNVDVYFESTTALERLAGARGWVRTLLGSRPAQRLIDRVIDRLPVGPPEVARRTLRAAVVGEAITADGRVARSILTTQEAYELSAMTVIECARRALNGDRRPGVHTAGMVYGADYILSFRGVAREDYPIPD